MDRGDTPFLILCGSFTVDFLVSIHNEPLAVGKHWELTITEFSSFMLKVVWSEMVLAK